MFHPNRSTLFPFFLAALTLAISISPVHAQEDALNLESSPIENAAPPSNAKWFIEGALSSADQRYQPDSINSGRASFDLLYSASVAPGLRAVLSNRLDAIHSSAGLEPDTHRNSLREAYLSWQPDGGDTVLDIGRVNLRNGPGYGFNPTDFFRDGSLRTITSADPFALRQNRMGSVMLRAQRLWGGGSLAVAYSPKLADNPSADTWNLDLGSTNNRNRGVITLGTQFSQNLNSQVLLYQEDDLQPTLGANMTALLSDAAVAYLEWTRGSEPEGRVFGLAGTEITRNRFVGGLTYTILGKTSITAEYEYNGFALDSASWSTLGTPAQLAYLRESLRRQELAPRQAYLIYVSHKGLGHKDLDLTAYVRFNGDDGSRLAWLELRHHWPSFDLTVQLQHNLGSAGTEFGILPDRRVVQALGTYYF